MEFLPTIIFSLVLLACGAIAIHLAFVSTTRNQRMAWLLGSLCMLGGSVAGCAFVTVLTYGVMR